MSFEIDIKKWAEKAEGDTNKIIAGTVLDLSRRIILRTPVDTGQARWGWIPTIGAPSSTKVAGSDKTGAKRISEATKVSAKAPGNIYYLTNNMPYIDKLEFGGYGPNSPTGKTSGGYSTQAPSGMVRITIREFNSIVNDQAKKTR